MAAARLLASASLLLVAPAAVTATPLVTLAFDNTTAFNDQVLYFTYQGLMNRDAARVWYYTESWLFWTDAQSTYYFASQYLGPQKGYTFSNASSFCDLYGQVAALGATSISGLALYNDTELDATRWLAVISSSLDGLLPVTPAMLSSGSYPCLASLPVSVDYRSTFPSDLAAYAWGASHLMPSCNKTFVYSAGHSYTDGDGYTYLGYDPSIIIGLDLAVASRAFVFNLSPDTGKYPAQAEAWGNITALLDPGRLVIGWAEPEPAMTYSSSLVGGAVLCSAAPNLSLWAQVASAYPALPYHSNPSLSLSRSDYYVSFQTNEGDTPKILAALQQGVWTDPRRGTIPIAWGLDPLVAPLAPGLVEYYASTATGNDTWFAGTAGAGYAYPWLMKGADFAFYTGRAGALAASLTPGWPPSSWSIDIWDNNYLSNLTAYKEGMGANGPLLGLFTQQPEELAGSNNWLPDGTPVIITDKALWYPCQSPNASTVDGMEATIRAFLSTRPPPFFFVIYGCLLDGSSPPLNILDYALEMQARLGPQQETAATSAVGGGSVGSGDATVAVRPRLGPPLKEGEEADGPGPVLHVVGIHDLARLARQAGPGPR